MDHDRYLALDFADIGPHLPLSRRDLFRVLGGGIIVFLSAGRHAEAQRRGGGPALPEDYNAFLRIGEDGRVTCFTGKIEMGQGVVTSLAQMLADELDVPLDAVDMVMGDTDLCPWDMGTFGSMSTRFFGPPLRAAGAEARRVLIDLGSERLAVPADRLVVENGVVHDRQDPAKRVSYAELAKGQRIERWIAEEVPVKAPGELTIAGKPVTRRDARGKVTGQAQYAADIRLPGMLCASILRPPAHGATLKSVDLSAAKGMPGVQVVQDGDLIAVLHEHPDEAARALTKVKAEFDVPEPTVDDNTIFDHLISVADGGRDVARGGDLKAGEAAAAEVLEETYLNGYVAHSPMEPHAATATIEGEKATVWASTQAPFRAKDEVVEALGMPAANVHIITPFVGGGFGGKTRNLQVVEAARLAKLTGRPVQVAWTRDEEFFYDSFRPAAVVKIRSGIDGAGRITFWDYHVYFAGTRGSEQFYGIENHATVSHDSSGPQAHPFATGAWRAPANNTNTFARESQIDSMAAKAKVDPVEFRLRHLPEGPVRGALQAAAEKAGWQPAPSPSGRGLGVACGTDSGTWVAAIAEVEVDHQTGQVNVKRVVCAQDMGLPINPQGATIQMEGCITMGLGYALTEEVHFRGGSVLDRNFDTYELPRFSWLPDIETFLVGDKTAPSQGGGEPAIVTMGAVIANAIHDATGARLFRLPMTPARVKEAIDGVPTAPP